MPIDHVVDLLFHRLNCIYVFDERPTLVGVMEGEKSSLSLIIIDLKEGGAIWD